MYKRFKKSLNESGALPAIIAGSILISATAILLAGFSVNVTKSTEMNLIKTNANYYLNACESQLETAVFKTLPSQFAGTKAKIDAQLPLCQDPAAGVVITKVAGKDYELHKGATDSQATSVKAPLNISIMKGGREVYSAEVVKYLSYSNTREYKPSNRAYIESFDANNDAVWVEPPT